MIVAIVGCKAYALQGLTLELSGGAAVRLNEMLDGCDATCSGDDVGLRRAQLELPTPQNYQF
jgi:hypothetical protein